MRTGAPRPPLTPTAKLVLSLLASALCGIAGAICGLAMSVLLADAGGFAQLVPVAVGLAAAGASSLFLVRYHVGISARAAATEMWPWFGVTAVAVLGSIALLTGVVRHRRLFLPESAPVVTALLLLSLPAAGSVGAVLVCWGWLGVSRLRPRPVVFNGPDELWKYSMNVVSLLRADGSSSEAADVLENGVRHSTSSGWEWLGELGQAAEVVSRRPHTSPEVRRSLEAIIRTARSRRPYGA